jgi:hypothetical protein
MARQGAGHGDGNDRLEEKVDLILKSVAEDGESAIARLDRSYQRD